MSRPVTSESIMTDRVTPSHVRVDHDRSCHAQSRPSRSRQIVSRPVTSESITTDRVTPSHVRVDQVRCQSRPVMIQSRLPSRPAVSCHVPIHHVPSNPVTPHHTLFRPNPSRPAKFLRILPYPSHVPSNLVTAYQTWSRRIKPGHGVSNLVTAYQTSPLVVC